MISFFSASLASLAAMSSAEASVLPPSRAGKGLFPILRTEFLASFNSTSVEPSTAETN